jgi:hypothetical protein
MVPFSESSASWRAAVDREARRDLLAIAPAFEVSAEGGWPVKHFRSSPSSRKS